MTIPRAIWAAERASDRRDIPVDSEEFRTLEHEAFAANQLAALLNVHDSAVFDLTDAQKEKAKACKTMDELAALAGEWGVELPNEVLDAVVGGQPILDCKFCETYDKCPTKDC